MYLDKSLTPKNSLGFSPVSIARKIDGQNQNREKTGIYEHPEIRRDFVFACGNEHVCPCPKFGQTGTHAHFHMRMQNLDESRDARY